MFCTTVLKIAPDDADAFACQIGSLLQLSEFDKTLALLKTHGEDKFLFERAYCFYRLKRYPEALKLLESHPQPKPTRILELEAQVVPPPSALSIFFFSHLPPESGRP